MQSRGFAPIFIIIGLLVISLLLGGAFYLGRQTQSLADKAASSQASPSPSPIGLSVKNVDYLSRYSSLDLGFDRKVFITTSETSQDLKIGDLDLTPDSLKTLYSIPLPGALGFAPPVYSKGEYLIIHVGGADMQDILIFNKNGATVTESVYKDNPELEGKWGILHYNGIANSDSEIKIDLFNIDGSTATANLDLKTGKLIPNSLVTAKK